MKINYYRSAGGVSHLLLVLIVAAILTLITSTLHQFTLLQAQQAGQAVFTQQTFYTAESAMYQTLWRLKDDPDWPGEPSYTDDYLLDGTDIHLSITEVNGSLYIEINADTKGTKRKLVGNFSRGTRERSPLDIILVIDRSGSMGGDPISNAKTAATNFVDKIKTENPDPPVDKIGLVSYSDTASEDQELTTSYDGPASVKEAIDGLGADGRTNIADALKTATLELDTNGAADSVKVIILLSDGVANMTVAGSQCTGWPCSATDCTSEAIEQARQAKQEPKPGELVARDYVIFSIFLTNITGSDCGDRSATEELGRSTLKSIAASPDYFYETTESDDLAAIYEEIAEEITSPGFFEFREEIPE